MRLMHSVALRLDTSWLLPPWLFALPRPPRPPWLPFAAFLAARAACQAQPQFRHFCQTVVGALSLCRPMRVDTTVAESKRTISTRPRPPIGCRHGAPAPPDPAPGNSQSIGQVSCR